MTPALEIRDMAATLVDRDRSFRLEVPHIEVALGEAVALIGPSGTGKTCLLELIGLLRAPDPGATYRLNDRSGHMIDVPSLWARKQAGALTGLRGRALGFVPQSGGLLPFLTLGENIALSQQVTGQIDADAVGELADALGLAPLMGLRPDQLSIGQRQRGVIARALAHGPALVLADEPTASLDPEAADTAMALIVGAAKRSGCAVIVSSHDLPLVSRHTTRGYRLGLDGHGAKPNQVLSRVVAFEAEPGAEAVT